MKKLLIGLLFGFCLVANAANNKLVFNDLNYIYDYSINKCTPQNFESKKFFFGEYNDGKIIVTEKVDALPGFIITTIGEYGGKEKIFTFSDTYGGCRLFEDYIHKNMNVDPKNYVNMKEKK